MDDNNVILISPPSTNRDGSQTFYILDPCSTRENTNSCGLQLGEMSAEVKNTGAIAVLSTSSSGGLHLTLQNKDDSIKIEEMDPESRDERLFHTTSNNVEERSEEQSSDRVRWGGKSEGDKILAVVNSESKHEVNFQNYETVEPIENHQLDTEQDDVEEGTLYIDDDNKYCESLENCEQTENYKNDVEKGSINIINVSQSNDNPNERETVHNSISIKNDLTSCSKSQAKDEVEVISWETEKQIINNSLNSQRPSAVEPCEAVIHGHLIKLPIETQRDDTLDFSSDSMNNSNTVTALTLLELAASGPSPSLYRHHLSQDTVEMRVSQLVQADDCLVTPMETNEHQPLPELTTLQPVPLEPPVIESPLTKVDSVCDSTPAVQVNTPGRKVTVSNDLVQRLLVNEESLSRPQFKHLSRPSVTKSEIAQEIYERSRQKYPYKEDAEKDVLFAMKIKHRLASRIASPEKSNELLEKTTTELLTPTSLNTAHKDIPFKCSLERKIQKNDAISDNIELLKILEDDPDDVVPEIEPNSSPILTEKKPKIKMGRHRAPLLKLHPELEKELALKQLQDFNSTKKKVDFVPEILKTFNVQTRGRPKKSLEFNNNSQLTAKRKINNSASSITKKMKCDSLDSKSATVDPCQITETLIVEGQDIQEDQVKDNKSLKQYSNKRLSRPSQSPSRSGELPMDILLNGVEDDAEDIDEELNKSTNKIFKATNTRKRQQELKMKHFANVLQRNKPPKRRGRPPKKRPTISDLDVVNQDFMMKVMNEQNKPGDDTDGKASKQNVETPLANPLKTKKMREIERLLGDEGAINMIYSVEQKRKNGGELKREVLPSYRRKKKDLMLKTKLVKSAVMRLSTSPAPSTGRISLRGQGSKDSEVASQQIDETSQRKMSVDSHDSHQSILSPAAENFSFPAKIAPAEASRIIRRHSSSSNYSSRSNSPRRLSIDSDRLNIGSPEAAPVEIGQNESIPSVSNNFINTSQSQTTAHNEVAEKLQDTEHQLNDNCKINSNNEPIQQPKNPIEINKLSHKLPTRANSSTEHSSESKVIKRPGRPKKRLSLGEANKSGELNISLAAAFDEFNKNSTDDIPEKSSRTVRSSCRTGSSSKVAVYSKNTPAVPRRKQRVPLYRELSLKRHDPGLVEITLDIMSSKIKNALNVDVMREIIAVLGGLVKDENCRVVLFNSEGQIFCQGVDFPALVKPTPEERLSAAEEMALAVKELTKTMAMFPKPIVAAVQGPAVGLGTTLLPMCDLVLAGSNATFQTPYAKLGQVPEGAASLTLPTLIGYPGASEMLYIGRKLSALEAQQIGLVTRIIPAETFAVDTMTIVTAIASHSTQALSGIKALLRHSLLTSLETSLVSETHLLTQHWTSGECQRIFSKYIEGGGEGDPQFIFS